MGIDGLPVTGDIGPGDVAVDDAVHLAAARGRVGQCRACGDGAGAVVVGRLHRGQQGVDFAVAKFQAGRPHFVVDDGVLLNQGAHTVERECGVVLQPTGDDACHAGCSHRSACVHAVEFHAPCEGVGDGVAIRRVVDVRRGVVGIGTRHHIGSRRCDEGIGVAIGVNAVARGRIYTSAAGEGFSFFHLAYRGVGATRPVGSHAYGLEARVAVVHRARVVACLEGVVAYGGVGRVER